MDNSILRTIRRLLNLSVNDTTFDLQLLVAINSAIFALSQLGVGIYGIEIVSDAQTWDDLFGDQINVQAAKTFIFFKVRLEFDPPQTSFAIEAIERQIKELESRLVLEVESSNQDVMFEDDTVVEW